MKKITFFLLCVLMYAYCLAQPGGGSGITFTPPPPHPEIQEPESCSCNAKHPVFSCFPDCDKFQIETTIIPASGNSLVRITSNMPFGVEFTFKNESTFTYYGIEIIVFNWYNCQLLYPKEFEKFNFSIKEFKSIKVLYEN